MKALIFSCLLLVPCLSRAYVPLLNENSNWICTEGGWSPQQFKYMMSGDSVVDNITYQVIKNELVDFPGQTAFELLVREDIEEQRVYARWDKTESLLYDFNMEVGQTVEIAVLGCPVEMTCTGVGTIPILNGGQRNAWYFDFGFGGEVWIEGIGSINGPIAPGAYICTADWDPVLNCFYENNQLRYDNPDDETFCGLTGIDQLEATVQWEVLSINGSVQIKPQNLEPYSIQIRNYLGKLIYNAQTRGISEWNSSDYAGQILFISLETPYRRETHKLLLR